MHSKPKLALAILTSPGAAFEEILERGLLGTAVVITMLAGTAAAVPWLLSIPAGGKIELFYLGKSNPACQLGLCMLYALVLSRILKWIGAEISYVRLLTIMGWSQVLLLLANAAYAIFVAVTLSGYASETAASLFNTSYFGLQIWYAAAIAIGLRTATDAPLLRGIMTYMTVAIAGGIAFGFTFQQQLLLPFSDSLFGIMEVAKQIVSADNSPWLAGGFIGLAIGLWQLGKALEWDRGTIARAVVGVVVVGVVVTTFYLRAIWADTSYYKTVVRAHNDFRKAERLYENNRADWLQNPGRRREASRLYVRSARELERLLPILGGLKQTIGDIYFIGEKDDEARRNYEAFRKEISKAKIPDEQKDPLLCYMYIQIGSVDYAAGRYADAVEQFKKAANKRPRLREPWVRLVIVYDRTRQYDKALFAAEKAIKRLKSEAIVGRIAYAQALLNTGKTKEAEKQIKDIRQENKRVAARIGKETSDWMNAVDKLTRYDLRSPLEQYAEPKPEKPKAKPEKK